MYPMIFGVVTVVLAVVAMAAILPRAIAPPDPRQGRVLEIIGPYRVAVLIGETRMEVTTARGLPVSVGDRVRLARRAKLFGITLIPLRLRRHV